MRSQTKTDKASIKSTDVKNTSLGLVFIMCCVLCYPNFDLLADPLVPDSTNSSLNSSSDNYLQSSLRTKIYFYNPEINTARNLVLKTAWDDYLYGFGSYEFQPVDNVDDFKSLVHREENAVFIMAEWFYSSFFSSKENDVELAFKGLFNGKDTYQKVLVSHSNTIDLSEMTIACSGTNARAKEVIKSIYPNISPQQIDEIKILLVPKDIDALMAVGYGLAGLALTTELGLAKMALLNEHVYKDMFVIKTSQPLKRSVLVFKSSNKALKASLAHALLNMSEHAKGRQAINLLGLDEWQLVDNFSALNPKKIMDESNESGGHNNDK